MKNWHNVKEMKLCSFIIFSLFNSNLFFSCEEMLFEFTGSGYGNGTATTLFGIVWATPGLTTSSIFHPLDNSQKMRVVSFRRIY